MSDRLQFPRKNDFDFTAGNFSASEVDAMRTALDDLSGEMPRFGDIGGIIDRETLSRSQRRTKRPQPPPPPQPVVRPAFHYEPPVQNNQGGGGGFRLQDVPQQRKKNWRQPMSSEGYQQAAAAHDGPIYARPRPRATAAATAARGGDTASGATGPETETRNCMVDFQADP